MLILGIETSCDETAAAVVKDGREICSNIIASQIETHRTYGGVVPEIASRMHCEAISQVVQAALAKAAVTLREIDAIAVTYAPGLVGALLVGVNFAKGLALSSGLPLIPVHHLRGHVASNYLCANELSPPFLCLIASGGHSHLVMVDDYTTFTVIGRTRDDAAGESFDKAARCIGLPYPGGVELDKLAETGNSSAYAFPRPKVQGAQYDYSFSGLKTSMVNLVHKLNQKNEPFNRADLAASYRAAVIDYLLQNMLSAADNFACKTLAVAGGVSANRLLRRQLVEESAKRGCALYLPSLDLCGDNAAMIASQGYYEYLAGSTAQMNLNAIPSYPLEKAYEVSN